MSDFNSSRNKHYRHTVAGNMHHPCPDHRGGRHTTHWPRDTNLKFSANWRALLSLTFQEHAAIAYVARTQNPLLFIQNPGIMTSTSTVIR